MSENENSSVTPFDEMVQTRELQMLKTIVPYVNTTQQNQMVLLIQLMEFRHTARLMRQNQGRSQLSAASLPEGTDKRSAILSDLRRFCTPHEQELIDQLINLFTILENYEMFTG